MTTLATRFDPPLRIMLTSDTVGGVWHYTLALAEGLVELGCSCVIVVLGPAATPSQRQAAAESGAELFHSGRELDWLSKTRADLVETALELSRLAEQLGAHLAHVHSPVLAAPPWRIPVVAVAHSCTATWWDAVRGGGLPEAFVCQWEAMQGGIAAAQAIIAPTHAFASALERVYGKIAALHVVYNGVRQSRRPTQDRSKPGYIFSAGRLWDVGKNMTMLDEAAGMQPYAVILAGSTSGPDGSVFSGHHVSTPGVLFGEALRQAFRQAVIFASPSLYEPFGLAVLEAATVGIPLLLADIPTFRELWDDAAMFLPPRNAASWAKAISSLMKSKDKLDQLGEAAWQRSMRYQQQDMVGKTLALYRSVLAGQAFESACP